MICNKRQEKKIYSGTKAGLIHAKEVDPLSAAMNLQYSTSFWMWV